LVLAVAIGPAQGNPGLDAITQVDCDPSQVYGDPNDAAAAAALEAAGYGCTGLFNKGQLPSTFQRVGELWHRLDGTILRSRVIFFGGSNTGFGDSKFCLDDDPDPINNIAPGGANPSFCEGGDSPLSFNQGGDGGPNYPPAKAANVAPEEAAGKFEIRIEGLTEVSEVFGGTTVGGWNININGYTEVLPHFNKGGFSIVAYFQPVRFPDVSVDKTPDSTPGPPGTINAGDNAVFTITVTNNGPVAANNVVLRDVLPNAGLTWTVGGPDAAACSPSSPVAGGTELVCNFERCHSRDRGPSPSPRPRARRTARVMAAAGRSATRPWSRRRAIPTPPTTPTPAT
jgi:uncharacterized repeat protein (TIGR01451 family)